MNQQNQPNQSSLAWYKLAALIRRGEKEKVLKLYRLLSHSFEDTAFARQVEGDIFWAFADVQAVDKYAQAANMYYAQGKLHAALGLYQSLASLDERNTHYSRRCVELAAQLGLHAQWRAALKVHFTRFSPVDLQTTEFSAMLEELIQFHFNLDPNQRLLIDFLIHLRAISSQIADKAQLIIKE